MWLNFTMVVIPELIFPCGFIITLLPTRISKHKTHLKMVIKPAAVFEDLQLQTLFNVLDYE